MYRLFLIAGLLILFYYLLRRAIQKIKHETGLFTNQEGQPLGNKMVQDPVCRVFIPLENAVKEEIGGQKYFFCSRGCATTFQKQMSI